MLTIWNDPTGTTGRQAFELDPAVTLQENIERHLAAGGDAALLIDGVRVDPLTDPRLDQPPPPGMRVHIVQRPAGVEVWVLVISAVLAVYSYSLIPRQQSQPTTNESPNNKLAAQTNIARPYQAIPDVYGYRRVWPDLIQPSVVEYIGNVKYVTEWLCVSQGKCDLTQIRYAETPIEDIDGADFEVFYPATGPSPYPELNSTTLTDVIEAFEVADVNGQEIRNAPGILPIISFRPATYVGTSGLVTFTLTFVDSSAFDVLKSIAGTGTARVRTYGGFIPEDPEAGFPDLDATCNVVSFTTSGGNVTFTFSEAASTPYFPDVTASGLYWEVSPLSGTASTTVGPFTLPVSSDGIRWNIVFLRGLTANVTIEVTYWKINSAGAEISGTRTTIIDAYDDADTFDQRFFTRTVFPTSGPGRYRIQFERTNSEAVDGSDIAKLESVYAIRRYVTKVLPGVTAMRATTKATQQATGFRERKYNCYAARHVRTLSSTAVSASRNFARVMAHVWALAGENISGLDTTKLAAINAALGEDSPLLRFDGSLDDADMPLGQRLQLIAFHARCVLWRDGGMWTVTRDESRPLVEAQLDYRNLAAGGESAISYASHLPASFDGVEIEYTDETTQATKAFERINISTGALVEGSSANPKRIKMPGCTTQAQAENRARLEARRLLYQRESVRDAVLNDGGQLGIGTVVRWIDPHDFAGDDGLQAGEVMAISGSTVTLSEPVDFRGEADARVLFTGVDGAYLGAPVLCTPGAAANQVVLSSLPGYLSGIYVRNGTTRMLGSRYAFGPGLTESEIQAAGKYVVAEIDPNSDGTFGISLTNYDERLYADDGVAAASAATIIIGNGFEAGPAPIPGGVVDVTGGVGETPMPTWQPPDNIGLELFLYDSGFVPLPSGTFLTSAPYGSLPGNSAPFLGRVVFYIPLEVGETYTVTDTAGGYAIPGTARVTTSNGRVYELDIEGAGATSVGTAQRTA